MAKTVQLTDENGINIYPKTIGENVFINNNQLDKELNKFIVYDEFEDDIEDVSQINEETKSYLLDRSNHTGTQGIDTIDGLIDILDSKAGIGLVTEEVAGLMSAIDKIKLDNVDEELDEKVPMERKINNKPLSDDIDLTAVDVGAPIKYVNTITLTTTWTGSAAPYTQTVNVSGMVETDTPVADIVQSATWTTAVKEREEWAKVVRAVTATDSVTFYATEKTTVSLIVQFTGVR